MVEEKLLTPWRSGSREEGEEPRGGRYLLGHTAIAANQASPPNSMFSGWSAHPRGAVPGCIHLPQARETLTGYSRSKTQQPSLNYSSNCVRRFHASSCSSLHDQLWSLGHFSPFETYINCLSTLLRKFCWEFYWGWVGPMNPFDRLTSSSSSSYKCQV